MGTYINDIFRTGAIAGTGLRASRSWMNIIANNISNANTLDTGFKGADGNFVPYAREVPVFEKVLSEKFRENKVNKDILNGVRIDQVAELKGDVKKVYDPSHPAARRAGTADAGYVYYPNINMAQEMADMKVASLFYEANISIMGLSGKMMDEALSIGRR